MHKPGKVSLLGTGRARLWSWTCGLWPCENINVCLMPGHRGSLVITAQEASPGSGGQGVPQQESQGRVRTDGPPRVSL